jgi:hypothetical protein
MCERDAWGRRGCGLASAITVVNSYERQRAKACGVEASHTLGGAGEGRVQGRGKRAAYEVA